MAIALMGPVAAAAAVAGDDDVVVLPPWIVSASYDPAIQTARNDSFASTLGPTSVVSLEAWRDRSVGTLAEALRSAPGVVLQESFGGFEPPRISIRGSGLDSAPTSRGVALLVDGLPLARGDGSFHSGLFDPLLFSRIEVYRGSMHAAVTPAALGGVLNASSFGDKPSATDVRIEAGSFGAARSRFTIEAADGPLQMRAAASLDRQDGWRERSSQERVAVNLAARRRLAEKTFAEASLYAAWVDYEVPGPLTLSQALTAPRSVMAAVDRDKPARWSSVVRLSSQMTTETSGGDFSAGFSAQRLDDRFRQLVANGETESTSDDLNAHATLDHHFATDTVDHHLLVRATCSGGVNSLERYANLSGERGPLFGLVDLRSTTAALSVEELAWLRSNLAVGAGATALSARREIVDRLADPGIGRNFSVDDLSPRAGLLWRVQPGFSIHAAVSRGIEPPAAEELLSVQGTPPSQKLLSRDLQAQRATTFEFGLRGDGDDFNWSLTAYNARWSDEILRLADANGQPRGAVNADHTRHSGIEATLRWKILEHDNERLVLSATGNFNRLRFVDDPVYGSNRLAGAPPCSGWNELLYEHPRGWFAAVESTWVASESSADHAGKLTYGGHTLFNVRAGWHVSDHFTLFASVRNIFDRTHIASTAGVLDLARNPAATSIFLPGNGRNLVIGLEWAQ